MWSSPTDVICIAWLGTFLFKLNFFTFSDICFLWPTGWLSKYFVGFHIIDQVTFLLPFTWWSDAFRSSIETCYLPPSGKVIRASVQDLSAVAEIEVLGSHVGTTMIWSGSRAISHVLWYRCRILNTPRTALIDILRNTLCTLPVRMTSDGRLLNVIVLSQALSSDVLSKAVTRGR